MPTIAFDMSGEGSHDLGSFLTPLQFVTELTTASSQVQYRSAGTNRRLLHVGWWAIATNRPADGRLGVSQFKYVEFEYEIVRNPLIGGDHVFWHIEPGNVVNFVFWY
ncbi:MAG TPA: hypothetical protein VKQ30_26350 [Ktedonobacterales bacterium]|nr:hypothetical protein [Ktedonobacterales bacterium]